MKYVLIIISVLLFFLFSSSIFQPEKPAEYYYSKAEMERENKQFKNAYKNYSRAIKINPDLVKAYWKRGLLKLDMDSGASAIKDFDVVINREPTGGAYYKRACTRWTLKDSVGACDDWRMACDMLHNHSCDLFREHCR